MSKMNLISQMKTKAETVQAIVKEISSIEDAFRYTLALTKQNGHHNITAVGFESGENSTMESLTWDTDLNFLKPPLRQHVEDIHTAITPVSWGIAETGTLVLNSASEDVRLATMLAETHVAYLLASQIIPDTESIQASLDRMLKSETANYIAFITGASRTADIERVLAIGVHGPRELHILIRMDL